MKNKIYISLSCLFIAISAFAQKSDLNLALQQIDRNNFYELDSVMDSYIQETGDKNIQKHWGRYSWQVEGMVYPSGDIAEAERKGRESFFKFQRELNKNQRSTHGNWGLYGPTSTYNDQYGRCLRFKIDPSDSNTLYVIAAGSGLWRSKDQGITWKDLTPHLPNLFLTDVAINYTDPNILFILTGDGETAFYGGRLSYGVLKSEDGGLTWQPTGFFNPPFNFFPHKLIMHPDDNDIMMIASNSRIIRTDDAWESWQTVKSYENFYDIEWFQGGNTVAYAISDTMFHMSLDTGKTWTQIVDADFEGSKGKDKRRAIATSPTDFNKLYVTVANDTMIWVYRSASAGISNSWKLQDSFQLGYKNQAKYNTCITISPFDSDIIFVGGVGLHRSLTQGKPGGWIDVMSIHADHHDVVFGGGVLYDLNDGGIAKSYDGGNTWYNITPGILVSENYRIDGTTMNTSFYMCGNQDVGGFRVNSGTFNDDNTGWGDIMEVLIDYTDADNLFASAQLGGLRSSTDGGLTWAEPTWEPGGRTNWITPYHMDTGNPKFIYMGRDSIYRMDFATSTSVLLGDGQDGLTKEIKQGFNNRNRLYAITGNKLYRTDGALGGGLATWFDVTNEIPSTALLERLAVNPDNHNEVYVVCANYSAGNKVFFSDQGGNAGTWQNISFGLPNIRVRSIAFHYDGETNHKLYIGTELGVFYKDDNLQDWVYFSNGMPSVPITDLYINTADNKIMAGTWGRGMWQSDLYSDCPNSITLSGIAPATSTLYYSANTDILAFNDYEESLGTNIHYQAGDHVDMEIGFDLHAPATFEVEIEPCPENVHPDFRKSTPLGYNKSRLVITDNQLKSLITEIDEHPDIKK